MHRRVLSLIAVLFMIAVLSMTQPLLAGEPLEQPTVLDAIPTPPIFQNPFMAPNNFSEIHLNAYQTDTTSASGPASASSQAVQQGLLRPITSIAGTMAFNARGQILTIRVGASPTTPGEDAQTLLLINPETLTVLAETDLPPRPSSGTVVSFSGGGYFYVDHLDRVVCVTATQEIRIYAVQNTQFVLAQTYDLSAQIDDASDVLNSVLPDSAGNLWFITEQGHVGYVNPASGTIHLANVRRSRARTRTKPIPNRSRPTRTGASMSSRTTRSTAFRSAPAGPAGHLASGLRPRGADEARAKSARLRHHADRL